MKPPRIPGLDALLMGLALAASPAFAQAPQSKEPAKYHPDDRTLAEIGAGIRELAREYQALREKVGDKGPEAADLLADVEVYLKAARWIVKHDEFYTEKYVGMTRDVLKMGTARTARLSAGEHPWTEAKGEAVRGFVSRVDGSVQPYSVIVPASYDKSRPARLDVVLHGRGATLNEVSFIAAHDGKGAADDQPGLVLHVFGRINNAYRWAGETDVFEAIDAVTRNYAVDEKRVVLRGFSMGGAGAWHLGLQHPSLWSSVEAGAGFTESRKYAKLVDIPDDQEKALHIYDSVDYALNAFNVPMVGYGGEDDPQLQASVNIKEALEGLGFPIHREGLVTKAEGIDFLHVIGARMGHKVDPVSAQIMKAFHDEHAAKGLDPLPKRVRFVTYTLKFNRAHWLTVEGLEEHYRKTTIDAEIRGDEAVVQTDNIAALGVDRRAARTVRLDDRTFPLAGVVPSKHRWAYFEKGPGGWETIPDDGKGVGSSSRARGKRPGLQGPIDDAFTAPFLCVQGTGEGWNHDVQAWADDRLKRFAALWSKRLRGDLPIKDDRDVTPEDIATRHLILFGDPGSNRLIERVLEGLPVRWTPGRVELAGHSGSANTVPVLIAPNPLNPDRHVVLNSGHTFGEKEFAGTNALLFPRLGDYGLIEIGDPEAVDRRNPYNGVKASGYFDEHWRPKENPSPTR